MIFKLIHQVQDDLISAVGPNSSYDDKVENVYLNAPDTPSDNRWIGIFGSSKVGSEREIGKNIATVFTYSINLVIAVNHSEEFAGQELLEKIEKRVLKSFNTSNLTTVSETLDSMTERVLDFDIENVNYQPNLYKDMVRHLTMTLSVRTQLEF